MKPREDCPDESHVLNSLALKGVFESSLKTLSVQKKRYIALRISKSKEGNDRFH